MATLKVEHTADGGREFIFHVEVHEDPIYWLGAPGVENYIVSQFRDKLSPVLEHYAAEIADEEKE